MFCVHSHSPFNLFKKPAGGNMWQAIINLINQLAAFFAQLTNIARRQSDGSNDTPNIYK